MLRADLLTECRRPSAAQSRTIAKCSLYRRPRRYHLRIIEHVLAQEEDHAEDLVDLIEDSPEAA